MTAADFVHTLSKEARREIVSIMLESRSYRALSEALGVTPAAISKYHSGKTHPSDSVMRRILEIADEREKSLIAEVIFNDLADSLESFVEWVLSEDLASSLDLNRLESAIAPLRLSTLTSPRRINIERGP